uniref:Uncharacterized protein n=1 Tax=Desulfobacca acetoxidans TaxID=60893 RepID=A0A7V4G7Z4_9BACT
MNSRAIAVLAAAAAAVSVGGTAWGDIPCDAAAGTTQHMDFQFDYVGGSWVVGVNDDDNFAFHTPDKVVLYATAAALSTRPASTNFAFIGVGPDEELHGAPPSRRR